MKKQHGKINAFYHTYYNKHVLCQIIHSSMWRINMRQNNQIPLVVTHNC